LIAEELYYAYVSWISSFPSHDRALKFNDEAHCGTTQISKDAVSTELFQQQQQQQHSIFSQASWGRLEMKPERNKFKVQAH